MSRLLDALAPGARVFVPTLSNESALLAEELATDPERARGVHFLGVQFPGIDRADPCAVHADATQTAFFMSPAVRRRLASGRAELMALDYLGIARWLDEDARIDVAIAQLTPPDADGWCDAGLAADFMPIAWARAKRRVAHLNPALPRLPGSFRVRFADLDLAVERDAPLLDFTEPAPGPTEARIAAHVATLVRDGDTLQFGIGGVPNAVASALANHRRLRLHGGLVAPAARRLFEAGALDRDARCTTGVVLGDAAMRAFASTWPGLWLTDVRGTHGLASIADVVAAHAAGSGGSRFVAVNGAVEVDLFGQVNAERAQGSLQAGAGGLPAFAEAAQRTPGGRLVVCLGATAKRGERSRIVGELAAGSLCTLPRHLADAVVTEHGVAELRGKGLDARAEALIAVADPAHRGALADDWRRLRAAL